VTSKDLTKISGSWQKGVKKDDLHLTVESKEVLSMIERTTNVTMSMFRSLSRIPVSGSCFQTLRPCGCGNIAEEELESRSYTLDCKTGRHQYELNVTGVLDQYKNCTSQNAKAT